MLAKGILFSAIASIPAMAIDSISVSNESISVDLSSRVDIYPNINASDLSRFKLNSAPTSNGTVYKIEILESAAIAIVFALTNISEEPLEKLLISQPSGTLNSFFPLINQPRKQIHVISAVPGNNSNREAGYFGDIFSINIGPRETVTYIALGSNYTGLSLWSRQVYREWEKKRKIYEFIWLATIGLAAIVSFVFSLYKQKYIYILCTLFSFSILVLLTFEVRHLIANDEAEGFFGENQALENNLNSREGIVPSFTIKAIPLNVTTVPQSQNNKQ